MLNNVSIIEQIEAIADDDVPQQLLNKVAGLPKKIQENILDDMVMAGWTLSQALNCEVNEKYQLYGGQNYEN